MDVHQDVLMDVHKGICTWICTFNVHMDMRLDVHGSNLECGSGPTAPSSLGCAISAVAE